MVLARVYGCRQLEEEEEEEEGVDGSEAKSARAAIIATAGLAAAGHGGREGVVATSRGSGHNTVRLNCLIKGIVTV